MHRSRKSAYLVRARVGARVGLRARVKVGVIGLRFGIEDVG